MAKRYRQGNYVCKNPAKYIGPDVNKITYRSSWEQHVFLFLDNHPNIKYWGSEAMQIPYFNPLKRAWVPYIPDLLVIFEDKNGTAHGVVYEIKPLSQSLMEEAGRSPRNRAQVAVNMMKWKAAAEFCAKRGLRFEVLTEDKIFQNTAAETKRRRKK